MTVLVTGSSKGIGRAIAAKFNALGHKIILNCSNSVDNMRQAHNEFLEKNKNVIAIQADVSDYDAVKKMFAEAERAFGNVDILINNAGISDVGLFSDMVPQDWEKLLNVNVKSVFNCCHNAIPSMISNKKGCIINISSIWGVSGASCEAVYSATKGAVNSFSKALGKELAPSGIRVNAIACGIIDTEMNSFLDDEEKKNLISNIPAMRMGKPDEIADLCVFLAGDSSSYIIGQTIVMDGGFL